MEWRSGDIGGMLPYSRMKAPPGDSSVMEVSEVFVLHERHFPDLIHRCPAFSALTVHISFFSEQTPRRQHKASFRRK